MKNSLIRIIKLFLFWILLPGKIFKDQIRTIRSFGSGQVLDETGLVGQIWPGIRKSAKT